LPELTRQFQLLHSLITVHADRADLQDIVDFSTQDARQTLPVTSETTIFVETLSNRYSITQDDCTFQTNRRSWDLAYALLSLIHKQAFQGISNHLRVHAACAEYRGSRFIVIGDKGAGKTSLMLKLLLSRDGFQVNGDEMVLIDNSQAMPFPRRFHVKSGYMSLFKSFQSAMEASPKFQVSPSHWLYAFSPAEAGFEWDIDYKPIQGIYFLTPNHGRGTFVEKCSRLQMLQNIMPLSYLSPSGEQLKIPRFCDLINTVKSYNLHIGNLDRAVAIIRGHMTRE